jgi:hypothetical protein
MLVEDGRSDKGKYEQAYSQESGAYYKLAKGFG